MGRNERESQERRGGKREGGEIGGVRDRWEQRRAKGNGGIGEIWNEKRKRGKKEEC